MKGLEGLTRVDTSFVLDLFNERSIYLTPQMFAPEGATIGDGTERALSTIYSSLGDAQAVFPFITALTQTIDYACIKAMSNEALGPDQTAESIPYTDQPTSGSTWSLINDTTQSWTVNEHVGKRLFLRYANGFIGTATIASNTATALTLSPTLPYDNFMIGSSPCGYISGGIPGSIYDCVAYGIGSPGEHGFGAALLNMPMFIPAGEYMLGSDTWLIRDCSGAFITGAGRTAASIFSDEIVFATDGLWYSQIQGLTFETTGSPVATVDIDGNVPGHPYTTRGVQGNTFKDCVFNGGTADYAFAFTRQGGAGGQGSENLFLNCHFNGGTEACYFQSGANALQNTFKGGNFQSYSKNGILTSGGDVRVDSVGFQSTYGYEQIVNDGYDINTGSFGVGERVSVENCRTESLRFFKGSNSQPPVLTANNQNITGVDWAASTPYSLNQLAVKASPTLGTKLYRVTTAGTSGGSEPTWPDSGTVSDGSVVWTMTDFFVVDCSTSGAPTLTNNGFSEAGRQRLGGWNAEIEIIVNTATTYALRKFIKSRAVIWADTTTGNQTITLHTALPLSSTVPDGTTVTVKKVTTDANTVTMAYSGGNGGEAAVIPGGSTGYVTLQYSQDAGVTSKWWIISKSF